ELARQLGNDKEPPPGFAHYVDRQHRRPFEAGPFVDDVQHEIAAGMIEHELDRSRRMAHDVASEFAEHEFRGLQAQLRKAKADEQCTKLASHARETLGIQT